jgi:hypothetical protein
VLANITEMIYSLTLSKLKQWRPKPPNGDKNKSDRPFEVFEAIGCQQPQDSI